MEEWRGEGRMEGGTRLADHRVRQVVTLTLFFVTRAAQERQDLPRIADEGAWNRDIKRSTYSYIYSHVCSWL